MKLALLLVGLAFSGALFLVLDWFHSARIQRTPDSTHFGMRFGPSNSCRIADPVRHHALRPNCASVEHWGGDSYEFFTNDLGFRDYRIREVPRSDTRPRILMDGNSFTEGKLAWRDSYVGKIAARFPQYDFLNAGVEGYTPSNYLNTARMVLAKGFDTDEVIVFISIADVQDEAAFYQDVDPSGAVTVTRK